MFPNYCFTRSAKEPGYDIVKRCYMPKDNSFHNLHRRASRHLFRSEKYSNSQHRHRGDSTDQKSKRVKRLRKPKKSNSIRNIRRKDYESQSSKNSPQARSVEFRLPPIVCETSAKEYQASRGQTGDKKSEGSRQNGGLESGVRKRENVIKQDDPNRDLQESFADFFSIIHDNVLEAVQDAVQQTIAKCFENTVSQIANLSAELTQQKTLLNKLYTEVTGKLNEQDDTNLNQFKFVTQMLIDNKTLHYRAQQNKERYKEERQYERQCQLEKLKEKERKCDTSAFSIDRTIRSTGGETITKHHHQHKLSQQQQPTTYHICPGCVDLDAKGKIYPRRQCIKFPPVKRFTKGTGTVSMPNIPRTEFAYPKNRIKKIQSPTDSGGGRSRNSSKHRFITTTPTASVRHRGNEKVDPYHRSRSCSRARRKLTQPSNPGELNQEDVRSTR